MNRTWILMLCSSLLVIPGTATGDEMLTTGEMFPSFELQAHDGSAVRSSSLAGSIYLVYFYPKADTPGCTKEACSFRDAWSDLKEANVKVFGVSYDTPQSNRAFAEKFNLPFLLLSDDEKALAKSVGATRLLIPVPKRISYLVGADGRILKAYPSVSPSSHAEEVLKDLIQLR
ncbi:MAG: peroxiredoxin [Acidobacteria bacterium]|nr:MAG: peroxiredoxin [Acidobacteriota bacterium]